MNKSEQNTVPCKWCSTPTPMLGTKMCDRCWELERRIRGDLELAQRMLSAEERNIGLRQSFQSGAEGNARCLDDNQMQVDLALDTGLECSECGHDNYEAVYGHHFGVQPAIAPTDAELLALAKKHGAFDADDQRGLILWQHMQPGGLVAFARAVLATAGMPRNEGDDATPFPMNVYLRDQQDLDSFMASQSLRGKTPRGNRWVCLLCKGTMPGKHGVLDDGKTPCPERRL